MNRRELLKLAGITGLMGGIGADGRLVAQLQPPMQKFYAPDRIRYDGRSFFIEDKPFFLFSGSFHYFRCPRELWPQRFAKIRDAGFNTIQTYASWNYHEPLPPSGPEDYSRVNMEELDAFLTMATEFGFYISMRVGPYMCGEWDTGGYPQWLMTKIPPPLSRHVGTDSQSGIHSVGQSLDGCGVSGGGAAPAFAQTEWGPRDYFGAN